MVCSKDSEIINITIDYRSRTDSQLSCSLDSQFPVFILDILFVHKVCRPCACRDLVLDFHEIRLVEVINTARAFKSVGSATLYFT